MEKFVLNLIHQLDLELDGLKEKESELLNYSKKAYYICNNYLKELREFIFSYNFKDEEEEIYFFKHLKPLIASKQIYFYKIYKIEALCIKLPVNTRKEYYQNEINIIKKYFDKKSNLLSYYITENFLSDQYYFVRKKMDLNLHLEQELIDIDFIFSTCFDLYFNKIRAYENLLIHLDNQIFKCENEEKNEKGKLKYHLDWTSTKTDLIELINALVAAKAINHGVVDMKKVTDSFQDLFQIDLKDFYRTFSDLKGRDNPIKFLDYLSDSLLFKIDNDLKFKK
jgi:hypothetical protein